MGLRRVLATIAVLGVAFSMLVTPANAQSGVRAGAPCVKAGVEVTKTRWVFTCTLKNGRLIWVRKPRTNPTPAPTPTPTWQKVSQQLLTNANLRRGATPSTTFDIDVSPSVPARQVRAIKPALMQSYETWHSVAPVREFPVLLIDEVSERWYFEQSLRFPGDNCAKQWWEARNPDSQTQTGAVCWGSEAEWGYKVLLFGRNAPIEAPWLFIHESVHVAQWSLLGPRAMNHMECWLGEGMAELYTGALTIGEPGPLATIFATSYRRQSVSNLRQLQPSASELGSADYWLDVIRRSEDRSQELCWRTGLGYSLGYLVSEKLIADFGEDRLFDWMRLSRETLDSDSAFVQVIGVVQDTWYAQSAAPYVAQEASSLLR